MDQALSKHFILNPMPEASRQRGSKHGGVQAHTKKRLDKFMRCTGKVKFTSWENANKALQHGGRKREKKQNVYVCNFCGCFHAGTKLTRKI
ncbi:MAG TPA: hypothetical protein VI522_02265 [Gammaproteobacteria bacterium]|nr:hypothetical protein [Gammaproteobacteria bacterium]